LTAQTPTIAVDLLRRAVASASGRPERAYGTLALHLADALNRTANLAEAEQVAVTALARVTDPATSTELHWTLSEVRINTGRLAEERVDLDQALAAPGLAPRDRARLLSMKARILLVQGSIDQCAELVEEALAEATTAGDNRDVAWALHIKTVVLVVRGRVLETPPLFDRALAAVADEPRLADLRLLLGINRAVALAVMDHMDEAIEQALTAREAAARSGSGLRLAAAQSSAGEVFFDAGRWDEALEAVLALPDEVKNVGNACNDHGTAALIHLHRGDLPETARHMGIAVRLHDLVGARLVASFACAHALLAEHEGRTGDALAHLTEGITGDREFDEVEDLLPDAIRLAHDTGDSAVQAKALGLAEFLWSQADVPHRAGTVHFGNGLRGRDPTLLRRAAERYRAARRPLLEAMALGAAAVAAAEADDRAEARSAFSDAADIYERLGATWDLARLQNRMWAHGIRRAPRVRHRTARHGWESLTPTETKVVDLVVRGMSNPQIAEELYLSPRTVGTHVSHILAKLNLNSRTDLVREAARRT
jgi:DNA-binding CsgD family transcriptional regulator